MHTAIAIEVKAGQELARYNSSTQRNETEAQTYIVLIQWGTRKVI